MANHEIAILTQHHDEWNATAHTDNHQKLADMEGSALEKITGFKAFTLEELQSATDNFSPPKMLGEGSNGQVFEGLLCGKNVAVKRLLQSEGVEEKVKEEFITEIRHLGTVNHKNILSPIGFCLDASTPLLVTEKLHSLHNALYEDKKPLMWSTRFQIALGVAKGLAYLHTGARSTMVHCDIKPGNILLNPNNLSRSYIADFGVVHLLDHHQCAIKANWYYGTVGYWAPEVRAEKRLSTKSDVYSFGKLLYALVTGKDDVQEMPAYLIRKSEPLRGVLKHLKHIGIGCLFVFLPWIRLRNNIIEATVESDLAEEVLGCGRALTEASTLLQHRVLCTQGQAEKRPSMERVRLEMESATSCKISSTVRTAIFVGIQRFRWVLGLAVLIPIAIAIIFLESFAYRILSSGPITVGLSAVLVLLVSVPGVLLSVVVSNRLHEIVSLVYWSADDDLIIGTEAT